MRTLWALVRRVCVILVALAVVLTALEWGLRAYVMATPDRDLFLRYASLSQMQARRAFIQPYLRYAPHRYLGYYPTPDYRNDKQNNRHNALGFRDDEIVTPKPVGEFRIACLGGSTTYTPCVGDYRYSYPNCVERELHARGYTHVNVINAGADGYTSYETLINLSFRVLDLEPDLIILLDSVNDVFARIVWPSAAFRGDNSGFRVAMPLIEPSLASYSSLARFVLLKLNRIQPCTSLATTFDTVHAGTFQGAVLEEQLQRGTYPNGVFQDASLERILQTNGSGFFERNTRSALAVAREHGIQPVLMTLPYGPGKEAGRPQRALITSRAFREALDDTNALVRRLGAEEQTPVYDLAQSFPKEDRYFQDGLHENFEGVQIKGRLVADFLVTNGLVVAAESR